MFERIKSFVKSVVHQRSLVEHLEKECRDEELRLPPVFYFDHFGHKRALTDKRPHCEMNCWCGTCHTCNSYGCPCLGSSCPCHKYNCGGRFS